MQLIRNIRRSQIRAVCLVAAMAATVPLVGCQGYDVSVNDTLVYGPASLFRDYVLEDKALAVCVAQAIEDRNVTSAEKLTALRCTNAGVASLEGLQIFSNLRQLKLSNNEIRNLVVLEQLTELQYVWLDANAVIDPVPLRSLEKLTYLDLSDNDALQCPEAGLLDRVTERLLPKHCSI